MHSIDAFFQNSQCQFLAGVSSYAQYRSQATIALPEIAFIGRSNVGKSSLINTLVNKHRLAHTSRTPGRTQQLNLYAVNQRLILVDMPGYGFARAAKTAVANWGQLSSDYLRQSNSLRKLFILIDSRRGIMPIDYDFLGFIQSIQLPAQVILTKTDLIKASKLQTLLQQTASLLQTAYPILETPVIGISAKTTQGITELRSRIILAIN